MEIEFRLDGETPRRPEGLYAAGGRPPIAIEPLLAERFRLVTA